MGWFSGKSDQEKSDQEKWDEQIAMNRDADWRSAHLIANKMEKCKHNPRNGGRGNEPYSIDDADPKRHETDGREGWMR